MQQHFSEQKGPRKYHIIYEVAFLRLFGCGSRIYSNTNIAKNRLDLQRSLDLSQLKIKIKRAPYSIII